MKRRAARWEYFIKGAVRVSGEPKVIYNRYDTILTHLIIHRTIGIIEYTSSKNYISVLNQRGFTQITVSEGFREQVLPYVLPEKVSTNI